MKILSCFHYAALMDESRINQFQRRQLTSHMLRKLERTDTISNDKLVENRLVKVD